MNRRGISPIVATLLLISFAVAIGVVIMNFGAAQVELEAQCPIDVNMVLSNVGGEDQLCYDGQNIQFTIENGVNIKVEGIIVNIIGSKEAKSHIVDEAKMDKLGNYLGSVPYDLETSGEIRQVKIVPKVVLYDEEQICIEKALVVEKIKSC